MPDRLAQAVRSGQLHPRERVQHALDRMAAAGELNAVTEVYAEQALAEVHAVSMAVLEEEFNGAANTMPFNITGHPAMSVPVGSASAACPSGCRSWPRSGATICALAWPKPSSASRPGPWPHRATHRLATACPECLHHKGPP